MALRDVDRSRVAWWTFGAVLAVAVLFVAHAFVGTLVFGTFVYYATRPIYRRVERRVESRSLAAGVSIGALVLPALALVTYAGLVVLRQTEQIARGADEQLLAALGVDPATIPDVAGPGALLAVDWGQYLSADRVLAILRETGGALDALANVGVFLVHVFVMVALAFYLLRDDHRIARWVNARLGDRPLVRRYASAVDEDFDAIFFGNILNAVVTGTIGVITYSVLNAFAPPAVRVPAAALVGLLAGVASLIPVVGMKLVYVPVALYMAGVSALAGFEGAWFVAAFVAVSFVVVDTIPDLVLRPYVSGRNLHVGSLMIAYTLGPLLFGWYGIFLLPMVLVLVVHFARVVVPELLDHDRPRPLAVEAVDDVDDVDAGQDSGPAPDSDPDKAESPS